jgi:hypothetical protein
MSSNMTYEVHSLTFVLSYDGEEFVCCILARDTLQL